MAHHTKASSVQIVPEICRVPFKYIETTASYEGEGREHHDKDRVTVET